MSADLCGTRLEGIDLEIMRGSLCLIMKEAIGEIECLFGDSITNISENSNEIHVEFEKNKSRKFDLVVGADGLHSTVRKLVFGDESNFSKEFGVYVSVFSIPNFLNLTACEIEHHSPQRFVNIYRDRKDTNAKVAMAFSVKMPFDSRNSKEQKKLIEEIFANSGWEMPRILAAMRESPDFYFDSMAQIHMPHWSKGRVTLVGDAAYSATPMSGQGTSIAIAGAYVLAGELSEAQGDHQIAFSRYEKLMRPFANKNQALAKMSASIMKESFYSVWLHRAAAIMPAKVLHYFKNLGLKRTTKAANALTSKIIMKRIVKKPGERRAEIIRTARSLFLTKDYGKTTMQDFMDHLGIAKGTIYHYFKSKEELLEAVVEDIVNQHFEKMEILIQGTKGNALQKIQALIEASKIAAPSVLEQLHERGNEAMHTRLLVAALMKQAPLYAKLIQQGCEEGIFQTHFPLECAEFILSAVQFLTDLGICPWTQEDLMRRNKAFPKLIEQLLQAPPNSFRFI